MTENMADRMPFAKLMGVKVVEAGPDQVVATLEVRPDLCTAGHILHGGAIMAFADALGALGTVLSMPKDAKGTTTIESKTNFLGAAKIGERVAAVAKPLSIGRRISVWQTTMTRPDGKPVAVVTQTQLVL